MRTSESYIPRSGRVIVLATVLLLLFLLAPTAQKAWAEGGIHGVSEAGSGCLQAQATKFQAREMQGGVELAYVGTSKSLKIPKTYGGKKVVSVNVSAKGLKHLNVSKATYLRQLICNGNKLAKLDISKNKKLTYLDVTFNKLTKLDISKNKKLSLLYCCGNKFNRSTKAKLSKWGNRHSLDNDW